MRVGLKRVISVTGANPHNLGYKKHFPSPSTKRLTRVWLKGLHARLPYLHAKFYLILTRNTSFMHIYRTAGTNTPFDKIQVADLTSHGNYLIDRIPTSMWKVLS
jgi:hypothetical protein